MARLRWLTALLTGVRSAATVGSLAALDAQVVLADGAGESIINVNLALSGCMAGGHTKHYQVRYLDPGNSPCGSGFNLMNGCRVTWTPQVGRPSSPTLGGLRAAPACTVCARTAAFHSDDGS